MGGAFRENNRRKELDKFLTDLIARNKGSDPVSEQRVMNAAQLRILIVEKDEGLRTVMSESLKQYSGPVKVSEVTTIREAVDLISSGVGFDRIIVDGNPRKDDLTVHDLLLRMKGQCTSTPIIVAYNSDAEAKGSEFNIIEDLRTYTFTREISNQDEQAMLDRPKYADVVHVDYKTRICGRQGCEFIRDPVKAVRSKLKFIIASKKGAFMKLKSRLESERNDTEEEKGDGSDAEQGQEQDE